MKKYTYFIIVFLILAGIVFGYNKYNQYATQKVNLVRVLDGDTSDKRTYFLLNGGNYVANIERFLDRLKVQLSEQPAQKVIFMLKFLQERKIA